MSTTLEPVLDALGYDGPVKQRGVIKLLQASGVFGDLPGVNGVLDDRKAQAILDHVTFPTASRAADWLHNVTQAHMLRPQGTERYQCVDSPFFAQNRADLVNALADIGALAEVKPPRQRYSHVLLLGSMESEVVSRLETLRRLWDDGVRFDQVHLLGSDRPLVPGHEPIATMPGANGATLTTEIQMMKAHYYDESCRWPEELRRVPVFAVSTLGKGVRANTRDTIESWLDAQPSAGSVLAISGQPDAHYQNAVVKAALPASFDHEIAAGAIAPENVRISASLDSLARQIDAGFSPLLEALRAQEPPPPPRLVILDPVHIRTDAATYQFRANGDGDGVTETGRYHTDRWDPILHGEPLLVHERLDGTLFVADGHHRLELAKRLNMEGHGPGMIAAQILREVDGYTPQDVKIIAAYKNIAEGQTDPVETARVFQEAKTVQHPNWLPSLQMDKGNLRMSMSLSKLSDPALDYVARGEVPPEVAAHVAERVPVVEYQEPVMHVLSEKMRLYYNASAKAFQTSFNVNSWQPAIDVPSPEDVQKGFIIAALQRGRKNISASWLEFVNQPSPSANTPSRLH